VSPARPDSRPSALLLVLLLTALAVGAAASIVVAARAAAPFVPPTTPEVFVSEGVVILFLVLLFGGLTWALIHQRLTGPSAIPGRFLVVPMVGILLLIVFVVVYRFIQDTVLAAHGTGNGTVPPPGNPPPPPPPPGPQLGGGGGTFQFLHLPSWTLFAAIVIVAVVAVAVVAPRVRTYLAARGDGRAEATAQEKARRALGHAARQLATGADPRSVVIDLYAGLLDRVEPLTGNLDPSTPHEIQRDHLVRLGIRPEVASELTALFEEARYSSHPLGTDAAERASRAISIADADLARRSAPP
jgi:hypothetical protein